MTSNIPFIPKWLTKIGNYVKLLHLLAAVLKYLTLTNPIAVTLRGSAVSASAGGLIGLYFIAYELFNDSFSIMKRHPVMFEWFTIGCMFAMATLLFIKGVGDFFESRQAATYTQLLERLSQLTTSVVSSKLDRFKDTGGKLTSRHKVFEKITKPELQIAAILGHWMELIREIYKLQEDEVTITIIHESPSDGRKDHFLFETHKSWLHTKAEQVLKKDSLAKTVRSTGESMLIADKKIGAEHGKYMLSSRDLDKGKGIGSAFCYPVKIVNNNYTDRYMISLITYNKRLCNPYDEERVKAIKAIFCDICRRIELELKLNSIKAWLNTPGAAVKTRSEPLRDDTEQGGQS